MTTVAPRRRLVICVLMTSVTNDDNAAVRLNVIQVGVISFDLQSEGWGDD